MIPAQLDLSLWTNSDYVEEFTVRNGQLPVMLNGFSMVMQWRRFPRDPSATKEFLTVTNGTAEGFYIVEPTVFRLTIKKATIKAAYDFFLPNVAPDDVVTLSQDVIFTDSAGKSEIWLTGKSRIRYGVTR